VKTLKIASQAAILPQAKSQCLLCILNKYGECICFAGKLCYFPTFKIIYRCS